MAITAGIDVGTGAVKAVIMRIEDGTEEVLARRVGRIRRREIWRVVDEVFGAALGDCDVDRIDYVATTGEGEDIPYGT
ncbi:MAG: benzoyl-CoA reductase subunit D, partial [Deltaproteobacteria bacterium]